MTPSEFKAWFDGFTEALEGAPSEDQWKRIKARIADIDDNPEIPVTHKSYWDEVENWGTPVAETTMRAIGKADASEIS